MRKLTKEELDFICRIYEAYRENVWQEANRVVSNHELAEDLTQDTFEYFMRHPEMLYGRTEGYIKYCLRFIARNRGIDCKRKMKHRSWETLEAVTGYVFLESTAVPSPLDIIVQKETQTILKEELEILSKIDRTILIAQYVYGMRGEEIADFLNLSENNVHVRGFRARKRLKRKMKKPDARKTLECI